MGSNYYGYERGGGDSSSSKKGKKGSSDKPKQPQRGLGVAQLEKIRLHSQMECNYLPSVHHNPYASNFSQVDLIIFSIIFCIFVMIMEIDSSSYSAGYEVTNSSFFFVFLLLFIFVFASLWLSRTPWIHGMVKF